MVAIRGARPGDAQSPTGPRCRGLGWQRRFGKDAFYRGALAFPIAGTFNEGPFVFQVKFVTGANAAGASPDSALRSALKAEVDRIAKRIAAGTWTPVRQYVLCTNVPVGDALRTEVAELLAAGVPGVEVHVLGYRDLCTALDAQPEIRLSYPEILGLRDLKGLLRQQQLSGVLRRSTLAIEIAEHNASSFVRTSAFTKAREKLETHRFVVLSGPPEAGKTTVARMLGLGSLTLGAEVFECRSPDDVFDAYDPESDQLFIADDAFGSTEFRVDQAEIWGNEMERLLHSVDARHRLIWTSRSAILNAAVTRMHLQGRGAMFPKLGEVEVDVSQYTSIERALMLRRHARASGLDATGREVVKLAARRVVDHEHFTPQRIKRFVDEGLPDVVTAPADLRAELIVAAIHKTIREPTAGMRQSLGSLDGEHRRVLTAMIDVGSKSATGTALRAAYTAHGGADDFDRLLSDLRGKPV